MIQPTTDLPFIEGDPRLQLDRDEEAKILIKDGMGSYVVADLYDHREERVINSHGRLGDAPCLLWTKDPWPLHWKWLALST